MVHKLKLKKGNIPDRMFNKTQLLKGIKVEKEHTDNPSIAKQIAKAHLSESPEYYKYLSKMEKCMEKHTKFKFDVMREEKRKGMVY
jgi:hypothetical protein